METRYHPRGCFVAGKEGLRRDLERRTEKLRKLRLPLTLTAVIEKVDGKPKLHYASSGGPCGIPEETWLPIGAYLRENGSYDVLIMKRPAENVPDVDSAIELMGRYIEENGLLKNSE